MSTIFSENIGEQKATPYSLLLVFLLVFFYILNTPLEIAGGKLPLSFISIGIGLLLCLVSGIKNINDISFLKYLSIYFSFLVFLFSYSAFVELSFSMSSGDYYFSKIALNVIICSIFSLFFSFYVKNSKFTLQYVFLVIFNIGFVNSVIIVISFFAPDFRDFLESVLFHQEGSNIDYQSVDWRLRGLASAGGASLSIFTAFCIVVGIICNKYGLISSNRLLFFSVVMLFAQFFVARTGLLISMFFVFFWFVTEFLRFKISFHLWLILVGIFSVWFFVSFNQEIARVLPFALEIFYNLSEGGSLETGSTSELLGMLYFPDNLYYFFFGFGCFEGCEYYRSDSGYLKSLSAVGVFFSLAIYASFFYILYFRVSRAIKFGTMYWKVLVIMLFIAELKEPFLYQNYLSRALILIIFFVLVQNNYSRKLNANLPCNN